MRKGESDPLNTDQVLTAARAGNADAFASLSEPYRLEIKSHCYRILGSLQDAEDLVQETFLRAWRRLETYEGRGSFRAWLYRIATNACLDALDRRSKRALPSESYSPADPTSPLDNRIWIEPYPDEYLAPSEVNPEARYDAVESISLAFLAAIHVLPPRQRCVLILSDVLDWQAAEIADILETSVPAVNSLLYRARSSLSKHYPSGRKDAATLSLTDHRLKSLLDQYLHAWESGDIDGIVSMLTHDATFPMPPLPTWIQGKPAIRELLSNTILAGDARGRWRLLPVRANHRPGFAFYRLDETSHRYLPFAIQLLRFRDDLLEDVITFGFPALFPAFNLPKMLEA